MFYNKMNQLLGISLLFLTTGLLGCATKTLEIVVLRDVPESPSFVVIPANDFLREVEFANSVEDAIISAGVKVVIRPSTKEVTTEKRVQGAEGRQAGSNEAILAADAKLTEKYFAFDAIQADYIVHTYANSRHVKISKKESREILAIFEAQSFIDATGKQQPWHVKIHFVLEGMGIPMSHSVPSFTRPKPAPRRSVPILPR